MGTSHMSGWHLNSAVPSAKWYTEGRKSRMEKVYCSSWGQFWRPTPWWVSKVKTWKMRLNRCPRSALQWYVLLLESNKGRRGKSAQTYLHMLTVYSWAGANVVWKMDPNNHRCSPIKIMLFLHWFQTVAHINNSACIDFMDKHTSSYTLSHTHKRKHTEATINYSRPIWEH